MNTGQVKVRYSDVQIPPVLWTASVRYSDPHGVHVYLAPCNELALFDVVVEGQGLNVLLQS